MQDEKTKSIMAEQIIEFNQRAAQLLTQLDNSAKSLELATKKLDKVLSLMSFQEMIITEAQNERDSALSRLPKGEPSGL